MNNFNKLLQIKLVSLFKVVKVGNTKNNNIDFILSQAILNRFELICTKLSFRKFKVPPILKDSPATDLIGTSDIKQYYQVSNRNGRLIGILRPECTYLAVSSIQVNCQKDQIYYIEQCFRNETRQKLRLNEFTQMGVEIIRENKEKLTYAIAVVLIQLKHFLLPILTKAEVKMVVSTDNDLVKDYITNYINNYTNNHNIKLEFISIKRFGNSAASYESFIFEVWFTDTKNNRTIELLGGGLYRYKKQLKYGYGIGYSIGLERLIGLISNYWPSSNEKIELLKTIALSNYEMTNKLSSKPIQKITIFIKQTDVWKQLLLIDKTVNLANTEYLIDFSNKA